MIASAALGTCHMSRRDGQRYARSQSIRIGGASSRGVAPGRCLLTRARADAEAQRPYATGRVTKVGTAVSPKLHTWAQRIWPEVAINHESIPIPELGYHPRDHGRSGFNVSYGARLACWFDAAAYHLDFAFSCAY